MSSVTILTSGSTQRPKKITHPWKYIDRCIDRSIEEIQLTHNDIVLDVFPGNTIAHYVVTAMPAMKVRAELHTATFEPFSYITLFKEIQPSFISLIPRHYDILSKTKGWGSLDMSCVRYMVTGSGVVSQEMIDALMHRGVQMVANWYGMTEMSPPVLIGYNSETFSLTSRPGYTVDFDNNGECIINGIATGDLFDVVNKKFIGRKTESNGKSWKTNI